METLPSELKTVKIINEGYKRLKVKKKKNFFLNIFHQPKKLIPYFFVIILGSGINFMCSHLQVISIKFISTSSELQPQQFSI